MRHLLLSCAVLVCASSQARADPATVTLVDPERVAGVAEMPEKDWSLKLRIDRPLSGREAKGLIALARPCSGWAHPLRSSDPQAAQQLFEQCVSTAMAKGFKGVVLLPGDIPRRPATAASTPALAASQLEAVMRVELECVGWLVKSFGVRDQDEMRASLNSFHVAKYKVSSMRKCLRRRLGDLGLRQGYADYRYRPTYDRPKNH